jgi:hypothetical protein
VTDSGVRWSSEPRVEPRTTRRQRANLHPRRAVQGWRCAEPSPTILWHVKRYGIAVGQGWVTCGKCCQQRRQRGSVVLRRLPVKTLRDQPSRAFNSSELSRPITSSTRALRRNARCTLSISAATCTTLSRLYALAWDRLRRSRSEHDPRGQRRGQDQHTRARIHFQRRRARKPTPCSRVRK